MLATKNETRRKPNRSQPAYVGGFVPVETKASAQALAAIYGVSVQELLRLLIDHAAKGAQNSITRMDATNK
jgi:hypothetical protein